MDYQSDYSNNLGTTSYSSSSFMDWFSSFTWQTWLVVVIVLAILGFNIFYYLAEGMQGIHNLFAPILGYFGNTTANTTKQAVNTSAIGVAGGAAVTANTINSGINTIQRESGSPIDMNQGIQNAVNPLASAMNTPGAMNTGGTTSIADNNTFTANLQPPLPQDIEPDHATSSVQSSFNKQGWCYIGEEQGNRSCAYVGVNDKCMSGDIFPTHEICVNPNLRQ